MIMLRRLSLSCVCRATLIASLVFFSLAAVAGENPVRYLRFDEVQETLRLNADSGLPGSEIQQSEAWDAWIRAQDAEVRGRVDRGIEDSISNLILYGTSFTSLPRVESVESAASESGDLAPATVARIHALATALPSGAKNERVRFVRDFLERKRIARDSVEQYFAENLRRFVAEQPTWIGLVPVGYADGFRRGLTGAQVRAGGELCPVVGTVSMDSFAVDLPDRMPVGTPVTLLGHGVLAEDHARVAGTINYELVCGINMRPERARRVVVDG